MNELRERLAAFGVSVLTDAEVVALTLGNCADPDLGRRVLDAVGTPHGLLSRRMTELACIPGSGPQRAQRLPAALELGRRATVTIDPGRPLMTADDVAQRMARLKSEVVEVGNAWERAGVRPAAWSGRPHHAFRKGFVSELRRAGADPDVVEVLVGHSLGLRGVYTAPDALPMRQAVDLIPPVTDWRVVVKLRSRGGGNGVDVQYAPKTASALREAQ